MNNKTELFQIILEATQYTIKDILRLHLGSKNDIYKQVSVRFNSYHKMDNNNYFEICLQLRKDLNHIEKALTYESLAEELRDLNTRLVTPLSIIATKFNQNQGLTKEDIQSLRDLLVSSFSSAFLKCLRYIEKHDQIGSESADIFSKLHNCLTVEEGKLFNQFERLRDILQPSFTTRKHLPEKLLELLDTFSPLFEELQSYSVLINTTNINKAPIECSKPEFSALLRQWQDRGTNSLSTRPTVLII